MDNAMNRTPDLPPELVARHGAGLRALARALLGREDEVDDVVQDTWVRFLEARPAQSDGVGAWLATVLRRGVVNRRRSEARRAAREFDSARPEKIDAEGMREREETLRVVVAAVLELDEPYRSVVLLRWFEGLPPREIAARLQVDATVVHTRLSRAHQKLREKLDRDLGPERSLARLGLLAGRNGTGTVAATSAAGVTLMSSKWMVGVGAAALAASASAYWMISQEKAPEVATLDDIGELTPTVATATPTAKATASPTQALASQTGGRTDVVAAGDEGELSPPWAPPAFEYELVVNVVDALDRPSGEPVFAAPAGHLLNRVGAPNADGKLTLKWRGFTPTMELDIAPGEASAVRRLRLAAGSQSVSLQLDAATELAMLAELPLADVTLADVDEEKATRLVNFFAPRIHPDVPCARDSEGRVVFLDPGMVANADDAPLSIAEFEDVTAAVDTLELTAQGVLHELGYVEDVVGRSAPAPAVVGQLRAPNGAPLAGARVSIRRRGDANWRTKTCNEHGEFALPHVAAGAYDVALGGGSLPSVLRVVEVGEAGQERLDATLDVGRTLVVRLLDAAGAPLSHWRIQVEDAALAFVDSASTDDDGVARIPNAPGRALNILASPERFGSTSPLLAARGAWVGDEPLELKLDLQPGASMGVLRVIPPSTADTGFLVSRLWRSDTNLGVNAPDPAPTSDSDPTLQIRCEDLLPGRYRYEALIAGHGVVAVEALVVEAGAEPALELGALPASGIVRFACAEGERGVEVEIVRRSETVETKLPYFFSSGERLRLPAGEYFLRIRHGERTQTQALEVLADSEATVRL